MHTLNADPGREEYEVQSAMDRLERFVTRRRRLVLAAWGALLLACLPFAARQTENLTGGGFTAPGSGSAEVQEAIGRFDGVQSETLTVVLARRGGDPRAVGAAIDRVGAVARDIDHVELSSQVRADARSRAADAVLLLPLEFEGTRDEAVDAAADLRDDLGVGDGPQRGVETYLVGQQALWAGLQDISKHDLEQAEMAGFPIVLVVLLAIFGSFAAAMLPLALGFGSVAITGAAIFFLSQSIEMSVFVTNIASMLGIGVAVDYSLFILSRYREEIRAGLAPDEARGVAMRTSGVAVAFSGVTVLIALAGLFLVDSTTLRSMAIGAILVVAVAILAAVTLMPALIRVLGARAYERGRVVSLTGAVVRRLGRRSRRPPAEERAPRPDFWQAWTERLMRRPVAYALPATIVLLVLAIPALSLEMGTTALRQFPDDYDTRVGARLAAGVAGPGAGGETLVVARFHDGTADTRANRVAVDRYARRLGGIPGVAAVAPPRASRDGRSVLVAVTPASDPESEEALALVDRLRADAGVGAALARVADVDVGGPSAQDTDFSDLISGSLWKILLFVMVFSYVVLLVLLRSVVLPLKAVAMNLLSVGAAYGVLVAVFQYGWLDGLTGYDSLGSVNALTPPLLLAVVFGLSMDYEVFLLSRVRERYEATGDTRLAVAQGLGASARTITSAAVIMVVVFGIFTLTGVPSVKEIGVGLAVAIALDATLVRLVLVPATMQMMGRWNWWLPGPLARVLPELDFETDRAGAPPVPAAPEPTETPVAR